MTVALSLLVGLATAIIGRPLEGLGSGYGGTGGVTGLVLASCAVGGPVTVVRRPRPRPWLRIGLWPLVVLLFYVVAAHVLDPCARGLFDLASRVGTQPVCEQFGREVSVHTRFHLLLHAGLGMVAVTAARRMWPEWRDWPGPAKPTVA